MPTISAKEVKNFATLFQSMVKYNMKVIFGNRFIWFVLAAIAFYFFIAVTSIYDNNLIDEGFIYGLQIMPGLLLIFYPMTFGIQNDLDAGILEILFGIPDYRYKSSLTRLVLFFTLVFQCKNQNQPYQPNLIAVVGYSEQYFENSCIQIVLYSEGHRVKNKQETGPVSCLFLTR